MKTDARRYFRSSSFKMALLFTVLLGFSALALSYVGYHFAPDRTARWLIGMSILFMAPVVLISFLISTFVVSRTNQIAQTAREIMKTGDLSRRIAIEGQWDDLSNTAFVLNELLARIEKLMFGIRAVSDNIAHDLRSPLTRLLNNLEVQRRRALLAEDKATLAECDAALEETTRLLATFNALMRIGNVEAGRQRQNFVSVDLRRVAADVAEFYEPLAEAKNLSLRTDLSEVPFMHGDRDLLFQAIANLVDNAVKFTPAGGRIGIALRQNRTSQLTVSDTGPGVSALDKDKIFDRFYRAESSRTTQGNGLGLSLVAAVMDLHDGIIELRDANPGLIVSLSF